MTPRSVSLNRTTKETEISVSLNIDGKGNYDIATGIGFFDHMLEQLARHSLMDITVRAKGDTHIDFHHTTEDTGILLGQALAKAMGDMKGIIRYGDRRIVMDEAHSLAAVDISGRPFLVWNVRFSQDKIGNFDTELFEEFFRSFATNAGITLHIENYYGSNNHHIIESCFKAVARALRDALTPDTRLPDAIPSTKGRLG